MTFWVIIDGITRFLTFFIIVFCLTSLFYWKKDSKRKDENRLGISSTDINFDIETNPGTLIGGSTHNSLFFITLFSLVVSSVIFAVDFFVFSTKLMDTKIKEDYCEKKKQNEKLTNIDNNKNNEEYTVQDSNTYDITYKSEIKDKDLDNNEIEMEYVDANHLYVPPDYKSKIEDLGYYYLMPEKWFVNPPVPPICLTQKKYKVSPTIAYNVNLKKVNKPM